MPHIFVYHDLDNTADVPTLLPVLHKTLGAFETVKPETVKAFSMPLQASVVGTDAQPDNMMLIHIRMKSGRDADLRTRMSKSLHDTARAHMNTNGVAVSLSVDISEMDNETYTSSVE